MLHLQEKSCLEEKKWSAGGSFPVGPEASVSFYRLDSRGISSRELGEGSICIQRLPHPGHEQTFRMRAGSYEEGPQCQEIRADRHLGVYWEQWLGKQEAPGGGHSACRGCQAKTADSTTVFVKA